MNIFGTALRNNFNGFYLCREEVSLVIISFRAGKAGLKTDTGIKGECRCCFFAVELLAKYVSIEDGKLFTDNLICQNSKNSTPFAHTAKNEECVVLKNNDWDV